jgi:6-pyruvoyltetrahydropterin/6-carboxytetrahydropterin synthase
MSETELIQDATRWFKTAKVQPAAVVVPGFCAMTVQRRLTFCAGHRVYGHESKCSHPHGHNYAAFITASAADLDGIGRVIDFGVIKSLVGGWIEKNWDHAFLYFTDDPEMDAVFGGGKYRGFPCPFNPTAENMAKYLLHVVAADLFEGTGVLAVEVTIEETENCKATARL